MRIVVKVFSVRFFLIPYSCLLITIVASTQSMAQKALPPPASPPRPGQVISAEKESTLDDSQPLSAVEEEMRAKRAIKLAEKQYQDNINRAREIAQVASELRDSMQRKTSFDREDVKRLDRLEKLTKKIRGEAGGEDNEPEDIGKRAPTDIAATISKIHETAEALSKSVQSTPRQVVSASVIDNANVLLELIRFGRTFIH